MSVFTISDLHLSIGEDKPMDIFAGWNDYEDRIKKNWKKIVNDDDVVVLPGDISWGISLEQALEDFKFIDELPGKKYILKGNHDYWWTTKKKMDEFFSENGLTSINFIHNNSVEENGISLCGTRGWLYDDNKLTAHDKLIIHREAMRLETSIKTATSDKVVVFLHYPPVFDQSRCDEIMDVLHKYNVKNVYYGHIHGTAHNLAVNSKVEGINFRLVSCDFTEFCPILII